MSENKCQFHEGDLVVVSDRARSKIPTASEAVQRLFHRLLHLEPLTITDVIRRETIFYVKLKEFGNAKFPAVLFSPLLQEVVKIVEIEDLL